MAKSCTTFFWRATLAEFLASTIYVCIVLGVVLNSDLNKIDEHLRIAITFGLTLAGISFMFAPSSGGYLNPAVTVSCLIARRINLLRAICYLIVQFAGALTGAAVIHALTPSSRRGSLGALELRNSTTHWQGFALESIMGFMVSFVFLSGTDPNREDGCFGCALAYGSVTVGAHLLAIPYTSCGINPARALAPAVLQNKWPTYHWIYWAGPFLGAVVAGLIYWLVFSVPDEDNAGSADLVGARDYIIERPSGVTNGGYSTTKI